MVKIYINQHLIPFSKQIQIKQKQCIIFTHQIGQNKFKD